MLISWPGTETGLKPVLFDAHYDVVPVEPGTEGDWLQPAFGGVVADGYLWGRGALDDKLAVISTLEAIESLLAEGYRPARGLLFSIAHDEEIGGHDGAANIARAISARGIELQYMIGEGGLVVEGSPFLPQRPMAMVSLAEKTYVTLTLTASGTGGHSSNPVDDNALVALARAVTVLHDNPFEAELISPVTDMLQVLGAETDGLQGWLMRNQWLSAPLLAWGMSQDPNSRVMVRNTTGVTMFNAGIKENVIPQRAEAVVNFRLLPGTGVDQLIGSVTQLIENPGIIITASAWQPAPPVADIEGVGYRRISRAISEVLEGAVVTPGLLTASTDTPHYASLTQDIYRFHPFSVGMDDSRSIHNSNERISLESVATAVRLSSALIQQVAEP